MKATNKIKITATKETPNTIVQVKKLAFSGANIFKAFFCIEIIIGNEVLVKISSSNFTDTYV